MTPRIPQLHWSLPKDGTPNNLITFRLSTLLCWGPHFQYDALGTQSSYLSTTAIIDRLDPSGAACGVGYRHPNPCIRGSDWHNWVMVIQGVLLLWLALRLRNTPRPCVAYSSQGTMCPVQTASSSIRMFYLCVAITAEHRRRLIISRGTDGKPWLQEALSGNQLIYLPEKLRQLSVPSLVLFSTS